MKVQIEIEVPDSIVGELVPEESRMADSVNDALLEYWEWVEPDELRVRLIPARKQK